MVQQIVLPIKDSNVLKMVQDTLLDSFCSYPSIWYINF